MTAARRLRAKRPAFAGSNVFILFDTSNYMYRGFVFAQDAIADFVRSLEGVRQVALYSYSRDLSRVRPAHRRPLRSPARRSHHRRRRRRRALQLPSAHRERRRTVTGRKAIVVFSNGPDNASLVPPEDVAELAQSTGTIIYMISTQAAEAEPVSTAVFERMSKATGGKAYFSKSWQDEKQAFASIRDDLAHLYAISYYPQPNPNHGWRNITVKLVGKESAEVSHTDSRWISPAPDNPGKRASRCGSFSEVASRSLRHEPFSGAGYARLRRID